MISTINHRELLTRALHVNSLFQEPSANGDRGTGVGVMISIAVHEETVILTLRRVSGHRRWWPLPHG
ncbi:MAG: hypothetical protein ACKO8O_14180, partial [Betaproteobacteria bacterium]